MESLSQSECFITGCAIEAVNSAADEQLLERLQVGDSAAFDQLYTDFHGLIYNLAYRILGEREEAFDLTQEVYLKIFRHICHFHGGSSLKTWIYRITVNACLNRHRWWQRRMRGSTVALSKFQKEEGRGNGYELTDARSSPEELAFRNELERQIQKGLSRLPEDQRAAVVLRDLEGLSYEEIAEALSISLGTVKSRIARGRELLRNELRGLL